jgi:small GTP-binding protein
MKQNRSSFSEVAALFRSMAQPLAPAPSVDLPIQFKFIVIGASGTGKTSIVRRLCDGKFSKSLQSTVGIEYFTHVATVGARSVKMMIWDTAGQERFYAVAKAYFRSAVGVVLVYDISDRKTFEQLPRWLRDARTEADPHCCVYLVGNKVDLEDKRTVSRIEAEKFAATHKLQYIETSAAEDIAVNEVFMKLSETLLSKVATGELRVGTAVGIAPPVAAGQREPESSCAC